MGRTVLHLCQVGLLCYQHVQPSWYPQHLIPATHRLQDLVHGIAARTYPEHLAIGDVIVMMIIILDRPLDHAMRETTVPRQEAEATIGTEVMAGDPGTEVEAGTGIVDGAPGVEAVLLEVRRATVLVQIETLNQNWH